VAVTLVLLWAEPHSAKVRWTFSTLAVVSWLGFAVAVRERAVYALDTLSGLVAALREEDFTLRGRDPGPGSLGMAVTELNALGDLLREQRLGAREASALLRKVLEEIDVAVLAFDDLERVALVNRAGARLLGEPVERLSGRAAAAVPGLAECLAGEAPRTLAAAVPSSCAAAPSGKAAGRTRWWCSPISGARCARRSGRPGSDWCASSATRSTTRSRRSARSPTACAS
jgi:PAS domain-containing protein